MAIVIPSKNIYGDPINAKIRDNVIDNVTVEITKVEPNNEYEKPVFNSKINIENFETKSYQKNGFSDRYAMNSGGDTGRYFRIANRGELILTYIDTPEIYIPRVADNLYVSRVYGGKNQEDEENIKFSVSIRTEIGETGGSYNPYTNTFFELQSKLPDQISYGVENISYEKNNEEYLNSKLSVTSPYRIESTHIIDNSVKNQISIRNHLYANGNGNWLFEGNTEGNKDIISFDFDVTSKIQFNDIKIEQHQDYYKINANKFLAGFSGVLSTFALESTNKIAELNNDYRAEVTKIVAEFEQLTVTVNGDTIGISLKDGTITYGNGNKPHTLSRNELLQNGTKTYDKITSEHLATGVLNSYARGKETAKLLCDIGEYKDEKGDLKISVKNLQLPMNFNEGDLVIPMTKSANNEDLPMSRYKDGNPKIFEVVKTNFIYDGATWQELTLQEATQKGE